MHLSALAPLASNAGNGHRELGAQNAGFGRRPAADDGGSIVAPATFGLTRLMASSIGALDVYVVAERVSGIEQLRRLRAAGCDYVQGQPVRHTDPC